MTHHHYLGLGPHGFHRLHYTQWGEPDNPRVVICVHGLTRTGRDFDYLARALAADYRVICPDVVGRGQSQWLAHKLDYSYPQYLADCNALIARSGVERVDWVGTSMGGLIGMMLAAQPGNPIGRLVINDVGPFLPKDALERIASYVGQSLTFASLEDLERYMRVINAPFGPLTDEQWRHMAVHNARQTDNGEWIYGYDPGIGEIFKQMAFGDVDLWPVWDAIHTPTLVLRGSESDVLRREDAEAMTGRGPKPQLVEWSGLGHAPALMNDEQIAVVRNWLLKA